MIVADTNAVSAKMRPDADAKISIVCFDFAERRNMHLD